MSRHLTPAPPGVGHGCAPGKGARPPASGASTWRAKSARLAMLFIMAALPAWAQSPFALARQASDSYRAGKFDAALASYRRALSAESAAKGRALLRYNVGTCLLKLERFAEARDELALALAEPAASKNPAVLYNLAHAFNGAGDPEKALEALRTCLVEDPAYRPAKLFYEWLLRQKPPEEEPPPEEPPPESPPPPSSPPPNMLEQLPPPPQKDMQDQMRPPVPEPVPGQKPW